MIDTVRITELNNELGVVQDGIERATERRHAIVRELVALLDGHDTPTQDDEAAPPASSTTTPERGLLGARPATAQPGSSPSPAAPAQRIACPECGESVRPSGIGAHRTRSKRHREAVEGPPRLQALGADLTERHARETFLCGRNCGRSFPSRERLNAHETQGTCQPAQTRPPTKPFRINGKTPEGFVEGFGQ